MIATIMTMLFLASMLIVAVAAQGNIVPDHSFESGPSSGLHTFGGWGTHSESFTTIDAYTGQQSVELSAITIEGDDAYSNVATDTVPKGSWFDNMKMPSVWYKLLAGSRSPYFVVNVKIVGGTYDGGLLQIISWQLDGLSPDGWTQYNNDDWHYQVFDADGNVVLFSEGHHTLADIQAMSGFDGTVDKVKVAIYTGYIFIETTMVLVDHLTVETKPPTIETTDETGERKNVFDIPETVYISGSGYSPLTIYDLYTVEDTKWRDGMDIPDCVSGTETSVTTDEDGNIPAGTEAWNGPLTPGKYDIVIDVNSNGKYDEDIDALDDEDIEVTAGFFVIPEYLFGSILGLIACFAAFAVFRLKRVETLHLKH